jgi:hypothetical protein
MMADSCTSGDLAATVCVGYASGMRPVRFEGFVGVLALVGCGGLVRFSEDGEGGNGGTTTNTNTNTTDTNTTTTTTNQGGNTTTSPVGPNTTTGPTSNCEVFCDKFTMCVGDNCLDECLGIYAPGCTREADAFLTCLIEAVPANDCDFEEDLCFDEAFELDRCGVGPCVTEACLSDGENCSCSGQCNGDFVEQFCFPVGPGQLNCDCFVNGDYEVTCFDDSPVEACSGIELSCCARSAF